MCRRLCKYLVNNNLPAIVENKGNVLQHAMCCSEAVTLSKCFTFATYQAAFLRIPNKNNTLTALIKAQRNKKNSSTLCLFCKKVNSECNECCKSLCQLRETDSFGVQFHAKQLMQRVHCVLH